jgi:SPP1 family predicted phage head-tail adaptor
MRAGQLREQIKIQSKGVVTRDDYGGEVIAWVDFATPWADVQPLQLRELMAAKVAGSDISLQITMRYLTGVTSDMRVLWNGIGYPIISVVDVESRHVALELLCGGPSPAT